MATLTHCCFLLILLHTATVSASGWSYDGSNGPSTWSTDYAYCGGDSQSPIDISQEDTEVDDTMGDFSFSNYDDTSENWTIVNNGHSITVTMDSVVSRQLSGGGLDGNYDLLQYHIHFGEDEDEGSEHTFGGEHYPMELHLVHTAASFNGNITAAVLSGDHDAIAVLGIMYQVDTTASTMLTNIIASLEDVQYESDVNNATFSSMDLMDLLPSNQTLYARYNGSLTTPGCYETVIWTVFYDRVSMTQAQFNVLRNQVYSTEEGGDDEELAGNFRPVQSLNGRDIKTTGTWPAKADGAGILRPECLLLLLLGVLSLMAF